MRHLTHIPLVLTGVVALHVLDDTLLQPEAGASAGDHLAGALIPLAALALAGALLWRARGRARAVLLLLVGFAGVTVGSEAAYMTAIGEPGGDEPTGLLALLAGLALLALGVVGLWRSRRRDGPALRLAGRRALGLIGALLVVFFVLYPLAFGYGATHIASPDVPDVDLGRPHADVTLHATDGVALAGWHVPSRNGAAVVIVAMGRTSPGPHARMLADHGYGVLVIDPRGWGASEGDPNAFGWAGARDVAGAAEWLAARPEVDAGRVGALGLSVGGEMAIEALAESDALAAAVSEGAGQRSVREFASASQGPEWALLPQVAVLTASVAVFGNDLPPPGLEDLAGRIERPLMLIYGEEGQEQERRLNPIYAEAAGGHATLWEVPASAHMGGLDAQPARYERRVVGFLDDALPPRPGRSGAGRGSGRPRRPSA